MDLPAERSSIKWPPAVHGIARRLGGDVEVDSRRDQGARFRVRLPIWICSWSLLDVEE